MGQKDPSRRSKRRAHKPTLDDELMELASVLADYQLDNNAFGWFRPPWRNGLNAAGLCNLAAFTLWDHHEPESALVHNARKLTDSIVQGHKIGAYAEAGELYNRLVFPRGGMTFRLLATGLRCAQLHLANSHGGGHVYNELLIPEFLGVDPATVEAIILEWRCRDAIGTTHHLQRDHNDRQRSAFTIAWRRGLYLAAYSLPPAF
jgi:hypothetical protein